MPIYESAEITRAELEKQRKYNQCAVCGERLDCFLDIEKDLVFLACTSWNRTHHEGIVRINNEHRELNTPTRREKIMAQFGKEKAQALEKYQWDPTTVITREVATEIVETLWKGAPATEKAKAILICATYQLNPLMNHLFLLKFNKWNKEHTQIIGEDWAVVIGIEAKRLMAHRKHKFTYLDLTPRCATKEELEKILGPEIDKGAIYQITKIKDLDTGAEAYGLGSWKGSVHGADKGNTASNMAAIRSESQVFKRLYPAEMPSGVEVVDERFLTTATVIDETTGEINETPSDAPELLREPTKEETKDNTPPDLASLTFKNVGEFYTACLKHFKLSKTQVEKETGVYDLSNPGQRAKAWQSIVEAYGFRGGVI